MMMLGAQILTSKAGIAGLGLVLAALVFGWQQWRVAGLQRALERQAESLARVEARAARLRQENDAWAAVVEEQNRAVMQWRQAAEAQDARAAQALERLRAESIARREAAARTGTAPEEMNRWQDELLR